MAPSFVIIGVWRLIVDRLEVEIRGAAAALRPPRTKECIDQLSGHMRGAFLKAYEDRLDAVVSAWIGVAALRGEATPNGDDRSAIWIARQRS